MAKVFTANVNTPTAITLALSSSISGAISNCASISLGSASNTNIELVVGQMIAQGLRQWADNKLHGDPGNLNGAGITTSYLETNVKLNSE